MSERFYFDIEHGEETIRDEEGVEAASFEEAMDEARSVIREMADELAGENIGETYAVIVRDASKSLIGRLPIRK